MGDGWDDVEANGAPSTAGCKGHNGNLRPDIFGSAPTEELGWTERCPNELKPFSRPKGTNLKLFLSTDRIRELLRPANWGKPETTGVRGLERQPEEIARWRELHTYSERKNCRMSTSGYLATRCW